MSPPKRIATSGYADLSQKVRAAALRCLVTFPDAVRFEALQGLKSSVIKDLGNALDDPLRVVRREAVECRAKW